MSEKLHIFFGVSNSEMRMGDENISMAFVQLLNTMYQVLLMILALTEN